MDGKECLKHLKYDEKLKHIPVLMYTTSSQSTDIEETMMSGAMCFITKPWGVNELNTLLSAIAHTPVAKLPAALQSLQKNISCFIVC
jgi:CheY-like chemotaxis protein